jgi:hypothetical protein
MDPAWSDYGWTGGWPTSVLFDREGMIRMEAAVAVMGPDAAARSAVISQCIGETPAV